MRDSTCKSNNPDIADYVGIFQMSVTTHSLMWVYIIMKFEEYHF